MRRRTFMASLLALLLPRQRRQSYLFRLCSIEVPNNIWMRSVVYKIPQWRLVSGRISWRLKEEA